MRARMKLPVAFSRSSVSYKGRYIQSHFQEEQGASALSVMGSRPRMRTNWTFWNSPLPSPPSVRRGRRRSRQPNGPYHSPQIPISPRTPPHRPVPNQFSICGTASPDSLYSSESQRHPHSLLQHQTTRRNTHPTTLSPEFNTAHFHRRATR